MIKKLKRLHAGSRSFQVFILQRQLKAARSNSNFAINFDELQTRTRDLLFKWFQQAAKPGDKFTVEITQSEVGQFVEGVSYEIIHLYHYQRKRLPRTCFESSSSAKNAQDAPSFFLSNRGSKLACTGSIQRVQLRHQNLSP